MSEVDSNPAAAAAAAGVCVCGGLGGGEGGGEHEEKRGSHPEREVFTVVSTRPSRPAMQ